MHEPEPPVFRFGLSRIQLKDGQTLETPSSGILVVIGPNGSGKSMLLKEISDSLRTLYYSHGGSSSERKWITNTHRYVGNFNEFQKWFEDRTIWSRCDHDEPIAKLYDPEGDGRPISCEVGWQEVSSSHPVSRLLGQQLVAYLPATDRANDRQPINQWHSDTPALLPLQKIAADRHLEMRLSKFVQEAFQFPICVNRFSSRLELLRGEPSSVVEHTPPSPTVVQRYSEMARVNDAGDGVKGFTRVLVDGIMSSASCIIIDEPELFLHPPQARLIGRTITNERAPAAQVVIATHSGDLLGGVLSASHSSSQSIKVIRLGCGLSGERVVRELDEGLAYDLWANPTLRSSGFLEALFHESVVLVEGPSDVQIYRSLFEHYFPSLGYSVAFVCVNGKDNFGTYLAILKRLGISTAILGDFDVLENSAMVSELVGICGGNFADMEEDSLAIARKFHGRSPLTVGRLRAATRSAYKRADHSALNEEELRELRKAIRPERKRDDLKRTGIHSLSGPTRTAAERLLTNLNKCGIFLVPCGETERWFPGLGSSEDSHGGTFASECFQSRAVKEASQDLLEWLGAISYFFHGPAWTREGS